MKNHAGKSTVESKDWQWKTEGFFAKKKKKKKNEAKDAHSTTRIQHSTGSSSQSS